MSLIGELRELQNWLGERGHKAVVCGGALRDEFNIKPVRDIDLYVDSNEWTKIYDLLTDVTWNYANVEWFQNGDDAYEHQYIQMHEEFDLSDHLKAVWPEIANHKIDLVGLRNDSTVTADIDGRQIAERFNLGMSQIWLEPQGVRFTQQFADDMRNRVNTVLRTDWGFEGTRKAADKFLAKYPDWQVVGPDGKVFDFDLWAQATPCEYL